MTDTTDKLIIQSESRGVKETSADLKGLENALGGVQKQSEQTERSTVSMESKFRGLERSMGTTAGQAEKLAKIQDTVNKAVAQSPELQARANDVLAAAKARYSDLEKSQEGLSGQGQALFHSIRSVGEQLALGISPTQALTGQLNHLSYAMTGQGGVSGAFNEIVGTFGKMLTPMRLLVGGVGGLAAGVIYLGNSWSEAAAEVNLALIGIGQRTGTTAADVNAFVKANSSAAGLSVAEARNAALEFTKTGNVTIANLKNVGEAIRGYSVLTGKDAAEATKTFTDAIGGDLLKGIENIDSRYGALNARTIEYIRTLIDQGDKTKALQIYIDAIASANQKAAESVGVFSRAWQTFKNIASNIANGPAPTSLQDQLSDLQGQRDRAANTRSTGVTAGGYLNTAVAFGGKSQELAELDRQIAAVQQKLNDFNAANATAQLDALSKKAYDGVNAILPQIDAIRQLDEAIRNIEEAQAKGVAPANADAALAVLKHQADLQQESLSTAIQQAQVIQALQAAWGGVTSQTALTLNNLNGQLLVAQQITAADQMRAQAIASYNALLAQGVTSYEAQLIAAQQLAVAQAGATAQVMRQVEALKDQNAMIKAAQNGTQAQTAAAIAYKNAIAAGADETAAAALRSETLKNNLLQAASAASSLATQLTLTNEMGSGGSGGDQNRSAPSFTGPDQSGPTGVSAMNAASYRSFLDYQRTPTTRSLIDQALSGGVDSALNKLKGTLYSDPTTASRDPSFQAPWPSKGTQSDIDSAVEALFSLKLAMAHNDKNAQLGVYSDQLSYLQSQPQSIENLRRIVDLQNAIEDLKNSTDSLNQTNQDLLSPYYSQDPRTSHIGFRSQGMASGGEFTVPGGYSANDNVLMTMPLASGEIVHVRRPGEAGPGGAPASIVIQMGGITIQGNANKDEVGRTMYQVGQTMAKQLAAARQ